MRLVIDAQQVTEVTMVIGNVELPLSREQVVEILFGGAYRLVPTGKTSVHGAMAFESPKRRGRKPKALLNAAPQLPLLPAAPRKVEDVILSHLARVQGASTPELRGVVEEAMPGVLATKGTSYLSGVILHLCERGALRREGERGSFTFSLMRGAESADERAEVARSARSDAARASAATRAKRDAKRLKEGLCMRCGEKKVVPGKKLCREHLKQIREVQANMVAKKRAMNAEAVA